MKNFAYYVPAFLCGLASSICAWYGIKPVTIFLGVAAGIFFFVGMSVHISENK